MLELPGVEKTWALIPLASGEYFVLVTPSGGTGLALLSSTRPSAPMPLPGARPDKIEFVVEERGLLLTWLDGGVIHQLSTQTRKAWQRPSPLPSCSCRLAVGSRGEVFLWSDDEAAFVDADGKPRTLDAAKFKDSWAVTFVAGKQELILLRSGESQRYVFADDTLARVDKPDAITQVKGFSRLMDVGLTRGWVRRDREVLKVMSNGGLFWSTPLTEQAFGVVRDGLVYAVPKAGGVALMRVEFPGGLDAWAKRQDEELNRPAKSREVEKAERELARVLEEARRASEQEEAKRRAEEARDMQEAALRTARWKAEQAEADRVAAEYKKKNPPPPPSSRPPAPTPAASAPETGARALRAQMTVAAETVHGFSEVIHERFVEDRPGVVYLGTPRVPPHAQEVLLMLGGDERFVSLVGFRFASPVWGEGARVVMKLPADQLRNMQLFGDVRGKDGATRLPLYVMVFAR